MKKIVKTTLIIMMLVISTNIYIVSAKDITNPKSAINMNTQEENEGEMKFITVFLKGWNDFSIPFDKEVEFDELYIKFKDDFYPWEKAVTESIIYHGVYGVDRVRGDYFIVSNKLLPGMGYRMKANEERMELYIKGSNLPESNSLITTFPTKGRELFGFPFYHPIKIKDFVLEYNEKEYSWSSAVEQSLVEGTIWRWDSVIDGYHNLSNSDTTLKPGGGYWIQLFVDNVSLKKAKNNYPPVKPTNPFPKNEEIITFPSLEDVDIYTDGVVDISDITLVTQHIFETVDPPGSKPYDINKDGICDYSDLNYILLFTSDKINLVVQVHDPDYNNIDASFYWDMLGDINDNGEVADAVDLTTILSYVYDGTEFADWQIFRMDLDGDGDVDQDDVDLIISASVGDMDVFPGAYIGTYSDAEPGSFQYVSTQKLLVNADYRWYAIADDGEHKTKSDVFNFTIKDVNNPPNEPNNPSPYDGEILVKITEEQADVNGDGKVSLADVLMISGYILNGDIVDPPGLEAYDVNNDGKVTFSDFSLVLSYYLGDNIVVLAVDVFDADNDAMNVSFYWDMLGDINDNGEVADAVDVTMILSYVNDGTEFADWQIFRMDLDDDGDVDQDDVDLMISASVGDIDVFPGSLIDIKENVPSGEIAYLTFTGEVTTFALELDFIYRWYAVADDGQNTTKSDVFSFSIKENTGHPTLSIEIKDGDGRVTAEIKNTGDGDALQVQWSILAEGYGLKRLVGFQKINLLEDGVIEKIPAFSSESSKLISSEEGSMDYKLGFIKITVIVCYNSQNGSGVITMEEKAIAILLRGEVVILRHL